MQIHYKESYPNDIAKIEYDSKEIEKIEYLTQKLFFKNYEIEINENEAYCYVDNYLKFQDFMVDVAKELIELHNDESYYGFIPFLEQDMSKSTLKNNIHHLIDYASTHENIEEMNEYMFNNFILNEQYEVEFNENNNKITVWLSHKNASSIEFLHKFNLYSESRSISTISFNLPYSSIKKDISSQQCFLIYYQGAIQNKNIVDYIDMLIDNYTLNFNDIDFLLKYNDRIPTRCIEHCPEEILKMPEIIEKVTDKCLSLAKTRYENAKDNYHLQNIGIEQKRYIPDWQLNYAGQYKNIIFNEIPENIPLEMKSKLFSTLDTIPDLKDLSNPRHENLTLSDFLDRFDFSYVLHASIDEDDKYYYPHGYITLEDEQGANLGDIEIEKYDNSIEGIQNIIERLDNYYNDYIFEGLKETLEQEHNINTEDMSWYDLYSKTKELNLDYDMDIMPYIFGEKDLVLDSNDVEISIDDIQSILNEDQEPEEDEGLEI